MPPGLEPASYVDSLVTAVEQVAVGFEPDLLIISAGFDGALLDPLGGFTLESEHFRQLTEQLVNRTAVSTGGRTVSVLEGGYNSKELGRNVVSHISALAATAAALESAG